MKLRMTILTLVLVFALLWGVGASIAQDATPTPEEVATAEALPVGDTVTTVIVTTEPAPSNTVQAFLAVLSGMLIDFIVPVLAAMAIALLYRIFQYVKSKIGVEQEALIRQLVNMAVQAAEQTGLIDEAISTSAQKKAFAIATLQDALRARGLGVFADYIPELEARIESAINQEVQKPYPPVATVEAVSLPPDKDIYLSAGRP